MSISDPRFIYILVSLPTMFGVTLVADGIGKILHDKNCGWISLFAGIVFLLTVGVVLLLASA